MQSLNSFTPVDTLHICDNVTQKFMPVEMVYSSHIRPTFLTKVFGSFPIAFIQSMKSPGNKA